MVRFQCTDRSNRLWTGLFQCHLIPRNPLWIALCSNRTTPDDHWSPSHPTKVLLCFLHMAEQVVAKPPRPSNVTHRWSLYYFHSVTSFDKQPASAKKAWSRHTDSRQGIQTPTHSIDSWSPLQSPSQSWRHRSEHPSVTMMMNIMMSTTLENLFLALNLRNYSTSSLPWLSLQGGTIILILINYIVDKIIYELEVYLYT